MNYWLTDSTSFDELNMPLSNYIYRLIEIGIDILNPVHITAAGMDSFQLKKDSGKDIVFWGVERKWVGLRYREWKIIRKKNKAQYSNWELYNLENNPYELQNILSTHTKVLNSLISRFNKDKLKDKLK